MTIKANNATPFLLLDGHGSRFDLQFLEYINSRDTMWKACIGVPYGTSYWQVGDSTEQNGCFKMALTKHKRDLLAQKASVGAEFLAIEKKMSFTSFIEHGMTPLLASNKIKTRLQNEAGHHLLIIVCCTPKSFRHALTRQLEQQQQKKLEASTLQTAM
ncbi:hypothetical protein MHU86_18670 [Fragilaria crotonensis]|nr:hypothetical protein MHU86_18670 [Fragilaria crotonensis]